MEPSPAVQKTVALYERILEAVPGGVVHVASDGAILLANERAQRFLGLSYDALSDRYIVDFSGETFKDDGSICSVEEYPVSRCLATGEPQPPEVIGVRQPSGEIRWAVFTALPFVPSEGEEAGAVVSFVDITERKRAEEQVRLLQAELAQRERLATVGTLAASVAHEVNNPLAYILLSLEGAADLVQEASEGATGDASWRSAMRRYIDDAVDGATRVRDIVRDLMTFSRVRDRARTATDVNAAVDTALRLADPQLRYRGEIVRELGEVSPVDAVPGRLSQVFLNLVLNAGNALDSSAEAGNQIIVRTQSDGGDVIVEVEDNGRGMDADTASKVFESFFTTREDGFGLGLAISRSIVEEIGGRIDFETRLGQGTTFRIRLPGSSAEVESPPEPEPAPEPAVRGARVLVVDDEPNIRAMITELLEPRFRVMTAGSVRDAVLALEAQRFDAIVCDTMLTDGAGVDVWEWALERDDEVCSAFVFITGGAFTSRVDEFLETVSAPILKKPFSGQLLIDAVTRASRPHD